MKRKSVLLGVFGVGLGLVACGQSAGGGAAATDEAVLVAALTANDDGSDAAWASTAGGEPLLVEGCGFGNIVARVVERFDADGSGDLNADERAVLVDELGDPGERFELLVSIYDTDGSGELTADELDALEADIETRCESRRQALLERFDADGDGALDADERDAARAALRDRILARVGGFGRGGFGPGGPGRGDGLGRGDGFGPPGRAGFGAGIRERLADRRAAITEEFDANGDGVLDAEEREALAQHLRACVRGEEELLPETFDEAEVDDEVDDEVDADMATDAETDSD